MSKELKVAIESNDSKATQAALAKVKDINRKLPGADKPLLYACKQGADRVIEVLVKAGAKAPKRFDPFEDPFVIAAEHEQIPVLERLLAIGLASPEVIEHALTGAAMDGRLNTFRCLLDETKPPITAKLFRLAAGAKTPTLIELLVQRGGDINAREHEKWANPGSTPMHSAAESGDPEEMKMLVSFGGDPNACDSHGKTPLMTLAEGLALLEVRQSSAEAITALKSLLELGANGRLLDHFGNCALCYYETSFSERLRPNPQIRKLFKEAGAGGFGATGQLFDAISARNVGRVTKAIANGADVNRIGPLRATPLLWSRDSLEITGMLLEAGADPNLGALELPLIAAARMGNLEVVKRLVSGGANIHAIEDHGEFKENAYTAAEMSRQFKVGKYLKSLGAGRPKPTQTTPLKPGVGSWNDFNEILVKADVPTVADALAHLFQGTVQRKAFGKSAILGDNACVVARPKGMRWSNVFRITPDPDTAANQKASLTFARQLAGLAKAPVLLVAYSDTSDAASVVRISSDGKTQRDDGWDYDTLRELMEELGQEAPAWARKLLKGTDESDPTSTERLNQLAELERFTVAQFEIRGEWGSAMEIQFGDLAESVFEEVAFVSN